MPFSESGAGARVIYTPTDIRQQLAMPKVSRDGSTVAFIAGIMSDFGSTGGDVYTLTLDGGAPIESHARHACFGDRARLALRRPLAGRTARRRQNAVRGFGRRAHAGTSAHPVERRGIDWRIAPAAYRPPVLRESTADAHESFTRPPEIEIGTIGHWRNLTAINAGLSLTARVQSVWWKSDGFDVQGWLLLPANADRKMPMITPCTAAPPRR